jgi:phosphoglycerate dehydrogenase-like enzyme
MDGPVPDLAQNLSVLTVASQLGEALDNAIAARVPNIRIIALPRGFPATIPDDAEVLFAFPTHGLRERAPIPKPPAWPHRLRWIQLVSAGADGYPAWLFEGVTVSCARGPSAEPMAEFTIAAIFAAAKSMPDLWVHDLASWRPRNLGSVAGATLGIYGFGAIGRAIAAKAVALGMRVLVVRASDTAIDMEGAERVADIAALAAVSDHLVLAAPNTDSTRGVVDRALLERAKPGLHLINVARGAIVDTDALIPALDGGQLGRVTLDTTDPEPLPANHPLYTHKKAFISPHTSMMTPGVLETLAEKLAGNLARFRAGLTPTDLVDTQRGY